MFKLAKWSLKKQKTFKLIIAEKVSMTAKKGGKNKIEKIEAWRKLKFAQISKKTEI